MNFLDSRLPDRFWSKCIPEPNSGCWLWFGAASTNGYGSYRHNGKTESTHRVAYETCRGQARRDLDLDHLCRNRVCCNPDHLELVSRSVNARRGECGVPTGRANKAKTHCPNGHDYRFEYRNPNNGERQCATCNRIRRARAA